MSILSPMLKAIFNAALLMCLVLFIPITQLRAQNCVCTNCPQFMPDNFVGDFNFNVMGATNPTLGQGGQGVCGVNMTFDHEYIGDLSIVLTSPSGQSVTLVGPIGLFGSTDFSTWNIAFVQCGDPASPDPGFSDQWSNNQPWGLFGNYTGSYYPSNGCLENFNSGPVNGLWTLTVTDGQSNDVGNFYNYEIIFCDPDGISCFSCAAEAGNLPQPDVNACQGSPNLNLNLPPDYTPPAVAPPTAEYSYTYVIGGLGGVILAYDAGPDLSGYDPGSYTVCGFSYLTTQENLIPPPDGSLTITQLTNQLASNSPPLCGDITGGCVNVTISELPPDEEETATICAPMCYQFYNQTYCQSGTYARSLLSPQGCPFTATLYLTVVQPVIRNVIETICVDACATTPGFEAYCSQGNYQEIFMSAAGCDSIVNLNLQVLNIVANIVPPVELTCAVPTQQLLGVGSTIGGGTTYLWTASNGGHIVGGVNSINALIDEPGDYTLRVCKTSGGASCCDSATVTVISNETPPAAPASIAGVTTICQGQSTSYTATTVAGATQYIWTVPTGVVIVSGQNTQTINVTWNSAAGGNVCAAAATACDTSAYTCLAVTVTPAVVPPIPTGAASVCAGATENYFIPPVSGVSNYTWSISGAGILVSGQGTPSVVVNWGNTPDTLCVNVTGDCGVSQDICLPISVTQIPASPQISGNATSCPGATGAYSVANVNFATSYQWQVTNGVINSGQGTNTVQVTWNANAANGIICANAANLCGNSADSCLNVNLSIPVAGPITTTCEATNSFYTVSFSISGGTAPYNIPGGVITNGIFTSNQIASGTPYNFTITDANQCVSAVIAGSFNCSCSTNAGNMDLTPLDACENQTVAAVHQGGENLDGNDVSAYVLHTNAGTSLGTVLGQNTTGIFGFGPGMSYETTYYISFVVGNNVGGIPDLTDPCLSVAQGQPVVFHQNPIADAGIDADTCGLSLTLQGNSGVGIGVWMLVSTPNGGNLNLSGLQNPNSMATATTFGAYQLSWTLDNSGCVNSDTVSLDFNDFPSSANLLHTCDAANENYTVSFQIVGGTPAYTVSGTPTGSGSGNNYSSNPIANGGSYAYVVTDNAGCTSPPITGAFSCNCATSAGTMDVATLSACEGATVAAVHLGGENLDGNDISGYFLHTGSANSLGTVYAENTTGVFGFQSGMTYGTIYYVSYVVGNSLNGVPDTSDFCLSVAAGQPVVFYQNPIADAGVDLDTCGTILNLQGNNVTGGSGQWTVTFGNTANININESINPFSSVSSALAGNYTLTWTLTQNGCVGNDQVNLQFNESPVLANLVRTCDAANENFTVLLDISGGTAPYMVNGIPATGNTFNSAPLPNGQTYTFNVVDANGCSMPEITGAFSCNCATNAGTMPQQLIRVCEGLSITATSNNNATLDANDIIAYVLHTGAGPALGQVFALNTTGMFSLQTGMNLGETYYISIVAGNPGGAFPDPLDPCFSVASGQPVVWLQNPTPNAGPDDEICGESLNLQAAGSGFSGAWTTIAGPGTATFTSVNDPVSGVTVNTNGAYTFQWSETNGVCSGADQVTIEFNQNPGLTGLMETCNGTNTQFVVTFTASGGTAPYTVVGLAGAFNGQLYTSQPVANNGAYSFGLVDANGCPSASFNGTQNCACATDAGSMQGSPLVFCANTPAVGVWNNDGSTDADDIIRFILHSTPGATLGTVFATNTQPTFDFGGNLQTGVTYYISSIAGSDVAGIIDLNDPCLSIAPGVPIQWKPMPSAALTGDATLCAGDGATLSFTGTGVFPLQVTYSDGANQNSLTLLGGSTVPLSLLPTTTTTYTLLSVQDGTTPTCTTALTDAVTFTVRQPVNAGIANEPVELCSGENINIVLSNLITGADLGGKWSETSTAPSSTGAFNANIGAFQTGGQAAGTYTFRYLLTGQTPCPNDEETVTVVIEPTPVADAGENQAINCDQSSVTLGGPLTTVGDYLWLLQNDTVGNTKQIFAVKDGDYRLQVTTSAGCQDDDETTVVLDNQKPVAEIIAVVGERCFNENNGSITIDSFSAAHTPVQFSLNDGPFQFSPSFTGLEPGNYTVTIMDPNGCESTTSVLTVAQRQELIADLGQDIEAALSDSVHLRVETKYDLAALDTIIWQPLLDSSATRMLDEQQFLPLQSWRVKVTVIDSNGCQAVDEILIRLDKPRNVFIPNVFNPDSDQEPILYVFGGRDVEAVESFLIFDRWGTQIFEQQNFLPNDPTKGWDGKYKGTMLDPAVFVYQVKVRFIDGRTILYKGDVTLVR